MPQLQDYVVDAVNLCHKGLSPAQLEKVCQENVDALKERLEEFAARHPGHVEVGAAHWLTDSVSIRTTPALAKEIAKLPGVAGVDVPGTVVFDDDAPEMKNYAVQSAIEPNLPPLPEGLTRDEARQARKDRLQARGALMDDFRKAVLEPFAAAHPRQVVIDPRAGVLSMTIAVQTTPELAGEIAKLPGVKNVWSDDVQIIAESARTPKPPKL